MSIDQYLLRLDKRQATQAMGKVSARIMATADQSKRLNEIDDLTPQAADILSMTSGETGICDIVEGYDHVSARWADTGRLNETLEAAVQILSRAGVEPKHRAFCKILRVDDYKEHNFIFDYYGAEIAEEKELQLIKMQLPENGQGENVVSGKVINFAASVGISRRNLVNDRRLGFLGRMTEAMIAGAYRKEAGLVYATLESNPNLSDGQPWFDASNSASGSTIPASIGAAMDVLMKQTLQNGDFLSVSPSVLLLPSGWNVPASDMLADMFMDAGNIRVIRSGAIGSGYLFADPIECPTVAIIGLYDDAIPDATIKKSPRTGSGIDLEIEAAFRVTHPINVLPISRRGVVKIDLTV